MDQTQSILTAPPRTVAPYTGPRVLMFYGPKKQGKTEILGHLPGCRIVDMELADGGTKYISKLDHEPLFPKSLQEVRNFCDACVVQHRDTGKWPYQFVAWDPLDSLEDWVVDEETEFFRNTPIGKGYIKQNKWDGGSILTVPGNDGGGGPGWTHLREGMKKILAKTVTCAPHVIWVAHLKAKFDEVKTVKEGNSCEVDLIGKARSMSTGSSDCFALCTRDPNKLANLVMTFRVKGGGGGSRCKHLEGKEIIISTMAEGKLTTFWHLIYPGLAAGTVPA